MCKTLKYDAAKCWHPDVWNQTHHKTHKKNTHTLGPQSALLGMIILYARRAVVISRRLAWAAPSIMDMLMGLLCAIARRMAYQVVCVCVCVPGLVLVREIKAIVLVH